MAADTTEPGGPLDFCIAAVLSEHPGIVTGWRQSGGGPQPPYAIFLLSKNGKIGETYCDATKPAKFEFKSKSGLYRYEMYERAIFPEDKARAAAPQIFVGPARVLAMELTVSFFGKPQYSYQMLLPGGYTATVEIDAAAGRLIKATVN
ncbi:MAG: hypothetical protein EXR36_07570 [Betaproteobacteria bacterium]|nr:hypothetical protein [Betaproteobacteria bacterium]